MGVRGILSTARHGQRLDKLEPRIVWILGSPRTGSTWLVNLLSEQAGVLTIDEPLIGAHLGLFAHSRAGSPPRNHPSGCSQVFELGAARPEYIFSSASADIWTSHLRSLILSSFDARLGRDWTSATACLIKEPNGSEAAPILMQTLPASRLLWLLRDGRDVVDSELDAMSQDSWLSKYGVTWTMTAADRLRVIEERAFVWLRRTELVQASFAKLPSHKRLCVRYEDLLDATASEALRIHRWLGTGRTQAQVAEDVERFRFDRLPPELRGSGKFMRSASPGAWRENLSAAEQDLLLDVLGEKLIELGYAT